MRAPVCMLAGLLLTMLIMDITTVWMVRSKVISAAELALDAALVGGLIEYDTKEGRGLIDENQSEELACRYFRENLKLDSRLENELLKDTIFELSFIQGGGKPRAAVQVRTVIRTISPKLLGLDGIPVTIKKNQYYVSTYK